MLVHSVANERIYIIFIWVCHCRSGSCTHQHTHTMHQVGAYNAIRWSKTRVFFLSFSFNIFIRLQQLHFDLWVVPPNGSVDNPGHRLFFCFALSRHEKGRSIDIIYLWTFANCVHDVRPKKTNRNRHSTINFHFAIEDYPQTFVYRMSSVLPNVQRTWLHHTQKHFSVI